MEEKQIERGRRHEKGKKRTMSMKKDTKNEGRKY